ncbi:MAG: peptidoglycan-binding protein [Gammaproteobacteria bacterium]|nr:peptidoglycan-binding protein [Gammaproteobacteria bacterium]
MCPVIQSINYRFSPDKHTQLLCQTICDELHNNGIALADISAESATSEALTITTVFNWQIKLSLKHRRHEGSLSKQTLLHKSPAEAQNAAKKQGQLMISSSSAKIELVRNINDDPAHYYKHSTIKLNSGQKHAFSQACSANCDHGQLTCKYCNGRGTNKITSKKDNLLGTTTSFDPSNICKHCGGKGSTDCNTCNGSGAQTYIYELEVVASRQHKNLVQTADSKIKNLISEFISQQTHKDLINGYLSPVVIKLEDIDETHCNVIYQSQSTYCLLKISVLHKFYEIIGFGDQCKCIQKPKILNDTLITSVNTIIGSNPRKNTSLKLAQLQSLALLKPLLTSEDNRIEQELQAVLYNKASGSLSRDICADIVRQISRLKTAITPRYNLSAWLTLSLAGSAAGFLLALSQHPPSDLIILLFSLLTAVLTTGYLSSKYLTKRRRIKNRQRTDSPTFERLPAALSAGLLIVALLSAELLSADQRWQIYYSLKQLSSHIIKADRSQTAILSNTGLIQLAQKYLIELGYTAVVADGIYETETEFSVKDFQKRFGLRITSYLDQSTMDLLTKYAVLKNSKFKTTTNQKK